MKELPDSEGWWWEENGQRPIYVRKQIAYSAVLCAVPPQGGRAIPVTDWPPTRWIKIEKPDFTKAE